MNLSVRPVLFLSFVFLALVLSSACNNETNDPKENTIIRLDSQDVRPLQWKDYTGPLPLGVNDFPEMLPAFQLPSERKIIGKADQYDDLRAAYPERYAITIPTRDVAPNAQGMVEWEEMQALLLTASGNDLGDEVDQGLAEMILGSQKVAGTDVYVIYTSEGHRSKIQGMMDNSSIDGAGDGQVNWVNMEHGTIWMIDYAPFPMKNNAGDVAFVDFRYYHQRVTDDGLPTRIGHEVFGIDTFRMPIGFEGGNLQVDTQGTCYVTQGLLYYNSWSEEELQVLFKDYLNCDRLTIVAPLKDEGTTHIDMFFKLVDDHTVILGSYTEEQDAENWERLNNNQTILESVELPDGQPITVHRMPMPDNNNHNVWRTYINSTFVAGPAGKVNLWPTYKVQENLEDEALLMWETLMPDWTHQKIQADTIITWGGAMHCISRTVQIGGLNRWVEPGSCGGDSCTPTSDLGYDGSCNVTTECFGPKWLCETNDCQPDLCQGYTFEGCCEDGHMLFCENNEIKDWDCQGQCGWNGEKGYYDCGFSGEGPDGFPMECPGACEPSCGDNVCGDDGCGGSCGSCEEGSDCIEGACIIPCEPVCDGSTCADGDDGCGGTCGCNEGDSCKSGLCMPEDNSCGDITLQGQCSGNDLLICNLDDTLRIDSCGECCAWNKDLGAFDCMSGNDCLPCEPSCDGATCGGDGCGGTCGSCSEELTCNLGECVDPASINNDSSGCSANAGSRGLGNSAGFMMLGLFFVMLFRRREIQNS